MTKSQQWLAQHSAHDFDEVLCRWRALIEPCCLSESILSEEAGYPVVAYRTREAPDRENGLYFCAGVHGDEPAGVWGLLEWAEANQEFLRDSATVIFPCFNPAGLVNNTRLDAEGRDLNRLFQDRSLSLIQRWQDFLAGLEFRVAAQLHEDYDARGIYLFELSRKDVHLGELVLSACEALIPRDPRTNIDGIEFERGIRRRTGELDEQVLEAIDLSYPEALYVYLEHAHFSLTFETPREFSLWDRVRSQRQFIDTAVRLSVKAG